MTLFYLRLFIIIQYNLYFNQKKTLQSMAGQLSTHTIQMIRDTLCYVMLCYVILCYDMLCYVMLYYVMICYVMDVLILSSRRGTATC